MEIQIELPNEKVVKNFAKWFRKEGFDAFTRSRYNQLDIKKPDEYITCLATDEKLTVRDTNGYGGQFFELQ